MIRQFIGLRNDVHKMMIFLVYEKCEGTRPDRPSRAQGGFGRMSGMLELDFAEVSTLH